MIRRPPRSTRTDTLFPYTTLFRSVSLVANDRTKIIDASTAHRVATGWTYGFPELEPGLRQQLSSARFVSNPGRSEEHTSELQSLMRISYAVFCLKKKKQYKYQIYIKKRR